MVEILVYMEILEPVSTQKILYRDISSEVAMHRGSAVA